MNFDVTILRFPLAEAHTQRKSNQQATSWADVWLFGMLTNSF